MKKTIAITGGSGFIGRGVAIELAAAGHDVICLTRRITENATLPSCRWEEVSDYTNTDHLAAAIAGADVILHLADDANRITNGDTRHGIQIIHALMAAMRRVGTERLIFASSIYARLDAEGQRSAYGAHKRAVEDEIRADDDIRSVILRLPPVYGPGGNGGFATLINLIKRRVPLPLGRARAPRAHLALSNLTDLIRVLTEAPTRLWRVSTGVYEPSDQQSISTRSLTVEIGKAISVNPKIFSMPVWMTLLLGRALGKADTVSAAFTPLQATPEPSLEKAFKWSPPQCMPATLDYLSNSESSQ